MYSLNLYCTLIISLLSSSLQVFNYIIGSCDYFRPKLSHRTVRQLSIKLMPLNICFPPLSFSIFYSPPPPALNSLFLGFYVFLLLALFLCLHGAHLLEFVFYKAYIQDKMFGDLTC